jgi:hypothetical protein
VAVADAEARKAERLADAETRKAQQLSQAKAERKPGAPWYRQPTLRAALAAKQDTAEEHDG